MQNCNMIAPAVAPRGDMFANVYENTQLIYWLHLRPNPETKLAYGDRQILVVMNYYTDIFPLRHYRKKMKID